MKGRIDISMDSDGSGYAIAKGDNFGARMLKAWLSSDNPDPKSPGAEIETHAREKRPFAFNGMGNNWGYYQFEQYLFLRSETDRQEEMQILLTAEQALRLLNDYEKFFAGDRRPTTIEVEFLAAGKEAKQKFEQFSGVELWPPLIQLEDEEEAAEAAAKGGA
ncbi:MAG: hypothetical protein AB7O39_01025 [Flavobacteriaceae bacterium]